MKFNSSIINIFYEELSMSFLPQTYSDWQRLSSFLNYPKFGLVPILVIPIWAINWLIDFTDTKSYAVNIFNDGEKLTTYELLLITQGLLFLPNLASLIANFIKMQGFEAVEDLLKMYINLVLTFFLMMASILFQYVLYDQYGGIGAYCIECSDIYLQIPIQVVYGLAQIAEILIAYSQGFIEFGCAVYAHFYPEVKSEKAVDWLH
ncbi:hypothetical protein FGO68_gene13260 [Halteria grandinella]|uniref:Uncharacterized protein n=1 Tax=Halteria grandinella TaxID=5974 RepID=A0A8J8NI68_HALGN|nr:hypothetical protein FGO68_gene13260 [Halteria grandinella]